jgi:signal transduction histidine kinase
MKSKIKALLYIVFTCIFVLLLYFAIFHFFLTGPAASTGHAYLMTGKAAILFFLLLTAGSLLYVFLSYLIFLRPFICKSGPTSQELKDESINRKEIRNNLALMSKLEFSEKVASRISHKLNNALFTISNSFQLTKRYLPTDNKRVTDSAQVLQKEIKRVKDLSLNMYAYVIRDIEEFTHSDIPSIINAAINFLKWDKKLKNTVITFKQHNSSFPIFCNPGLLQQVFLNLIVNTVEATDGKGKITIDIAEDNQEYKIVFIDNGPGVPDAVKPEIFLPYKSTGAGKGAGLGLYISYTIITNHNGTITLDDAKQKGAHFIIKIPKEKNGGRSNDREQVNTISR